MSRIGLPLLIVITILTFASSNSGDGVYIEVALTANGQRIVNPPPAMEETLLRNVIDMWTAKVYPLAIFIAFFSGMWPYMKLVTMLVCWFMPTHKLSVHRRQSLLEFLDAFGKWSLVDTYVLVMMMVAFDVPLSCQTAIPALADVCKAAGMDGEFRLYILPDFGFHQFLIATIVSLSAGLWMSNCHRYAEQIGEFGPAQDYEHDERTGSKRRLSNLLLPAAGWRRTFHKCIPALLVISMVLCVCGVCFKTFQFRFLGVLGYVLGDPKNVRENSLITLATSLPGHSINPNTFGIRFIETFFLLFSGVTVVFFLAALFSLWVVPMTVLQHRKCLVLAQVMNSVSGLDVFVVSILASVLEIQQYALFILNNIGLAGVNPYLEEYLPLIPVVANKMDGFSVFDLNSRTMPGFVMLACACGISTILGLCLLHTSSKALFDTDHRPLQESFAEAAGSAVQSPNL